MICGQSYIAGMVSYVRIGFRRFQPVDFGQHWIDGEGPQALTKSTPVIGDAAAAADIDQSERSVAENTLADEKASCGKLTPVFCRSSHGTLQARSDLTPSNEIAGIPTHTDSELIIQSIQSS
jgi:hypothetical protein